MLRISDFLHKLGICLHFQRDRVLKHYIILRPEWATNAVYAITLNEDVIAAKGCFTRTTAEQIWKEADYANLGDELLQLMENFNLCYPIPGLSDTYIAPQLLDYEPPDDYEWDGHQDIVLCYEYEFMPKGIITQLIVRLYRWIENQQVVWRSGVVLNNRRARAEVIETYRPYRGEIFLRVSGIHRKEVLSVIVNEIDDINGSFEKIKVTKKIPCNCPECKADDNPHFFNLGILDRYLEKHRYDIVCDKSCLDVSVRNLLSVIAQPDSVAEFDKKGEQEEFDRLKRQHTELHPAAQQLQAMNNSSFKFQINNPQNVQIVETTAGGDAVIYKYANNPGVQETLNETTAFLKNLQHKYPEAHVDNAKDILDTEIVHIKQAQPQRWQQFHQQLRSLPKDLRNPERLMQASKSALVQVTTDLTDNIFLNAFVAFIDGLSSEP